MYFLVAGCSPKFESLFLWTGSWQSVKACRAMAEISLSMTQLWCAVKLSEKILKHMRRTVDACEFARLVKARCVNNLHGREARSAYSLGLWFTVPECLWFKVVQQEDSLTQATKRGITGSQIYIPSLVHSRYNQKTLHTTLSGQNAERCIHGGS